MFGERYTCYFIYKIIIYLGIINHREYASRIAAVTFAHNILLIKYINFIQRVKIVCRVIALCAGTNQLRVINTVRQMYLCIAQLGCHIKLIMTSA